MIWTYDNFSNEMQNQAKLTHFEKFQQWITQNMWYIGAIICIFNNKLQNISFKYSFIWKSIKDYKKTHDLFIM
jgi:hypothetical protein